METYKTVVKQRLWMLTFGLFFCTLLLLVQVFDILETSNHTYVYEFQSGLATGFLLIFAIRIIKTRKCLSNEEQLRRQMIIEQDERMRMIRDKTGGSYAMVTSILILIAGIIAGYFNEVVFVTLLCTGTALLLIRLLLKAYYMHKY